MGRNPYLQEKLRALLKDARKKAALSQAEVARRLRQPQSFVSKYESGERRLDLGDLKQVCDALGIALQDLVRRWEES